MDFITTDADKLYNQIITSLENSVGESLYPGDERRLFAEIRPERGIDVKPDCRRGFCRGDAFHPHALAQRVENLAPCIPQHLESVKLKTTDAANGQVALTVNITGRTD